MRRLRLHAVTLGAIAFGLTAGCVTQPDGTARAPYDSIRGVLAKQPPLDTTGMTEAQIASAERQRYTAAVLESKRLNDRRRRMLTGGRGGR